MVLRVQSSGMGRRVVWHMETNISEVSGASIFCQVATQCWYLAAELHATTAHLRRPQLPTERYENIISHF